MLWDAQYLIRTRPNYPTIQHNTYGPFSQFSSYMYNHFCNITSPTINYLEGRHSPVKKHVNSQHPNIYVAMDLLQKEQSLASMTRLRDNLLPKRLKNNMISEEYYENTMMKVVLMCQSS